jgi:hypothetical protein
LKIWVAGVAAAVVLGLSMLGSVFTSIPYATDRQLTEYADVAKAAGLDLPFSALVAVDGVRFHQDYSRVNRTTMQQTAELFAMCAIPKPINTKVVHNEYLIYRIPVTVRRPLVATWQVTETTETVLAWIEDDQQRIYSSGATLDPGSYTVVAKAPGPDVQYRLIVNFETLAHCGPKEVEQVMTQLGFPPDDQKMALNLMAAFIPPGEFFFHPDPNKPYLWPVEEHWPITSRFGYRLDPVTGGWAFHTGVDIGAHQYTEVFAAADGVVTFAGEDGNYGNEIRINHGAYTTVYGHLEGFFVRAGRQVHRGDRIALVGSTGKSTGPHLHFEWRVDGTAVDPLPLYQ